MAIATSRPLPKAILTNPKHKLIHPQTLDPESPRPQAYVDRTHTEPLQNHFETRNL